MRTSFTPTRHIYNCCKGIMWRRRSGNAEKKIEEKE